MSVYVVFLQLGPALLPSQTIHLDPGALTLLTAFLAIAILVLSLVEQGHAYQLRAERLHECGLALNKLYDELENRRSHEADGPALLLNEISERYHKILMSVPENHDPIDNELFRAQHRHDFSVGASMSSRIHVKYVVLTYGLPWALIVGFPIMTVIYIM